MDKIKAQSLIKRYSSSTSAKSGGKEMDVAGRGNRESAMRTGGKPKNLRKTVSRLLKFLSKQRLLLAIALFCSIAQTVASLVASYLLRPIMNEFLYYDAAKPDITDRLTGLAKGVAVMAAVYAVAVLTQWLQQRLMLSISQRTLKLMRNELYSKLQTLPVRYFDTHPAGDIMSRFTNDIDTVGEMLNTTLIQIVSGAITIVGIIFLMFYTNPILGAITVVMTPLLTLASKRIIKSSRGAFVRQQKTLGMLNGYAEEMISGQKVVKVFEHEDTAVEEFEYLNSELCEAQIKAQFNAGIMGPVTHQLCNVCYGITACIGALLVVYRGFDIGGLAVSLNYTRSFNRPINEISMQMNTVFSALAGAERVFEVLDEEPEKQTCKLADISGIKGHVELKNVSFGYTPEVTVLHNISLYAKPGQKIAFVGSTGAGKTTVTNLLSRFYDIKDGTITVDGVPIEQIDRKLLRENIAMVLQDTHLFTGTVRENIRYGRLDATDEEVIEAAKISSAHSFIMHLKNGYDTVLEGDGANLSQGQRQLLNIARAAISRAPILILDEATSSVDTRTERHIDEGMDAIMENRTTFVIAHRLSTVRTANAIMVLEHGRIVERGTHEELLAMGG
ncbi:MAG: ABC transporter ATP-binding protein, partial [Acutalibacteraceae bacterium]|nr:ABC transporter ATP-binding protein [Acutalibacteraceae bacterium]